MIFHHVHKVNSDCKVFGLLSLTCSLRSHGSARSQSLFVALIVKTDSLVFGHAGSA